MATISDKPVWAIFLDIDGVLNMQTPHERDLNAARIELFPNKSRLTRVEWKTVEAKFLDNSSTELLHNLIDRISAVAKAEIIISSVWRQYGEVEVLKKIFGQWRFSEYIIARTPDFGYLSRASEISQWMKQNKQIRNIQSYIILDDRRFSGFRVDRFVEVDHDYLLTKADIEQAWKLIQVPIPPPLPGVSNTKTEDDSKS